VHSFVEALLLMNSEKLIAPTTLVIIAFIRWILVVGSLVAKNTVQGGLDLVNILIFED